MNYKKNILLISLLIISTFSFSQGITIEPEDCGMTYVYDNAGNRIIRIFVLCGHSGKTDGVDTISTSAVPPSQSSDSVITQMELSVLYPNPTNGKFKIEFNHELRDAFVSICDNEGRYITGMNATGLEVPIDLTNFSAGIYYIKVYTVSKNFQHSVIKQ